MSATVCKLILSHRGTLSVCFQIRVVNTTHVSINNFSAPSIKGADKIGSTSECYVFIQDSNNRTFLSTSPFTILLPTEYYYTCSSNYNMYEYYKMYVIVRCDELELGSSLNSEAQVVLTSIL